MVVRQIANAFLDCVHAHEATDEQAVASYTRKWEIRWMASSTEALKLLYCNARLSRCSVTFSTVCASKWCRPKNGAHLEL